MKRRQFHATLVAAGATLAVGSQGSHEKMQVTLAVTNLLPFLSLIHI